MRGAFWLLSAMALSACTDEGAKPRVDPIVEAAQPAYVVAQHGAAACVAACRSAGRHMASYAKKDGAWGTDEVCSCDAAPAPSGSAP